MGHKFVYGVQFSIPKSFSHFEPDALQAFARRTPDGVMHDWGVAHHYP